MYIFLIKLHRSMSFKLFVRNITNFLTDISSLLLNFLYVSNNILFALMVGDVKKCS